MNALPWWAVAIFFAAFVILITWIAVTGTLQ